VLPAKVAGRTYKGNCENWTVETGIGLLTGRVWDTQAVVLAPEVVGWSMERCIIGPAGE
jgi:hypothetical protein